MTLGFDAVFISCLLGGMVGGGLRACSTWNQDNWSRRSAGDLIVGSAMGVFLPMMLSKLLWVPQELIAQITPVLWFIACFTYGYTVASLVTNWITNYIVDRAKQTGVDK